MLNKYWLATYRMTGPDVPTRESAAPLLMSGASEFAIEVIQEEGTGKYAVLFSSISFDKKKHSSAERPDFLTCQVGFTNASDASTAWQDRGFPLVEADISYDSRSLVLCVSVPFFGESTAGKTQVEYDQNFFEITGVVFAGGESYGELRRIIYEQFVEGPDGAQPATMVSRKLERWLPSRSVVADSGKSPPSIQFSNARTKWPSLSPFAEGGVQLVRTWTGFVDIPIIDSEPEPGSKSGKNAPLQPDRSVKHCVRRSSFLGSPSYRFDDVEVLGFRIELDELAPERLQILDKMIEPLNFHLEPEEASSGVLDYRYRAATKTLLIELLRYGRMRIENPLPPLCEDDYLSQHELLVRILVGQVDDDTAQAHSPAVYVPAVFVDNPWSKLLGRGLQGFDKRMAEFWVGEEGAQALRLRPDGRVCGIGEGDPVPLDRISRVNFVDRVRPPNAGTTRGNDGVFKIMELSVPQEAAETWEALRSVDLAFGSAPFTRTRWWWSDFEDVEFRRSFARSVLRENLRGFRSIQPSPVTDNGLEQTWINGTFRMRGGIRIARPTGVVRLGLHAPESAPQGWRALCGLLGQNGTATLNLSTGHWYRLQCSMDFTVDDGLAWSS